MALINEILENLSLLTFFGNNFKTWTYIERKEDDILRNGIEFDKVILF